MFLYWPDTYDDVRAISARKLRRLARGVRGAYRGVFELAIVAVFACLARGVFCACAKRLIRALIALPRKSQKHLSWHLPQAAEELGAARASALFRVGACGVALLSACLAGSSSAEGCPTMGRVFGREIAQLSGFRSASGQKVDLLMDELDEIRFDGTDPEVCGQGLLLQRVELAQEVDFTFVAGFVLQGVDDGFADGQIGIVTGGGVEFGGYETGVKAMQASVLLLQFFFDDRQFGKLLDGNVCRVALPTEQLKPARGQDWFAAEGPKGDPFDDDAGVPRMPQDVVSQSRHAPSRCFVIDTVQDAEQRPANFCQQSQQCFVLHFHLSLVPQLRPLPLQSTFPFYLGACPLASLTIENYVKAIYQIGSAQEDRPATTGQLAESLKVSPSTVTSMLKTLSESGLATYVKYGGAELTEAGRALALRVLRRHRLIELFLSQTLKLSWDEVHDEAENMEHAVSDLLIDRIDAFLNYPAHDPHGDPIPRADGTVAAAQAVPLADLREGEAFRIERVLDQAPDFLRYLAETGLKLGAAGKVQSNRTEAGVITLRVGEATSTLSVNVAQRVLVSRTENEA
jgi:DtxR family Mn-dependent transcriptional regulator